jgi:uncharacterized protein
MLCIICIIAAAAVLSLAAGAFMYFFAVVRDHSGKRQKNLWEGEFTPYPGNDEYQRKTTEGANYIKTHITEVVRIKSHDGLTLTAHVIEPSPDFNPRGVFLMAHGYRSSGVHDFSCAAKTINDMGFSCLIIDQRAHGYSEGEKIGFGALEKYDISRWAAFAEEHFGLPIILDGVSMGSATVMMGAEAGYPSSVKAVIADCGYSNAGAVCRRTMKRWFHLPPFPVYYIAKLFTRVFAGYDLDKTDVTAGLLELRRRRIPILFAHGDRDDFVPYGDSVKNLAVFDGETVDGEPSGLPLAELFTGVGADHATSFIKDCEGYMKAIYRLLEKIK